jgi:hypothetical protein
VWFTHGTDAREHVWPPTQVSTPGQSVFALHFVDVVRLHLPDFAQLELPAHGSLSTLHDRPQSAAVVHADPAKPGPTYAPTELSNASVWINRLSGPTVVHEHMPNVNDVDDRLPVQSVPPPPVGTMIGGPPPTHFAGAGPVVMPVTQLPFEHTLPVAVQSVPPLHVPLLLVAPQCLLSSTGLMHSAITPAPLPGTPHSGDGHFATQLFDTQYGLPEFGPAPHTLPHDPQFAGSTITLRQLPPHDVVPNGH